MAHLGGLGADGGVGLEVGGGDLVGTLGLQRAEVELARLLLPPSSQIGKAGREECQAIWRGTCRVSSKEAPSSCLALSHLSADESGEEEGEGEQHEAAEREAHGVSGCCGCCGYQAYSRASIKGHNAKPRR